MMVRGFPNFRLAVVGTAVIALLLVLTTNWRSTAKTSGPIPPLVREHIHESRHLVGGRYYIPQSWQSLADAPQLDHEPTNILEAAELALSLALHNSQFLANSKIPLIVHQTWKSLNPETWRPDIQESVEDWLKLATNHHGGQEEPEMAYFLWDDDGLEALFKTYETNMWKQYEMLPYKVEKADTFRIAVLRWFGGVYADVDTQPLQHPYRWVQAQDMTPWTDVRNNEEVSKLDRIPLSYVPPSTAPANYPVASALASSLTGVGAILGIECDTRPERDDFWRMGYSYPIQVTNWAVAMAPHHPVAASFLENLVREVDANASRIAWIDPLDLTGPPAVTGVLRDYAFHVQPSVRFEAVTGLDDPKGGRGKIIAGDVLILPITGFSPGRGWHNNMGSEPVTHPNARLHHEAAGSWRHKDFKVEVGKLCRTFFGQCREWSKIPDPTG